MWEFLSDHLSYSTEEESFISFLHILTSILTYRPELFTMNKEKNVLSIEYKLVAKYRFKDIVCS